MLMNDASPFSIAGSSPEAILHPGCKINLFLRITGILPNGYHELDTLFYPLSYPRDTLRLRQEHSPTFHLHCNEPDIDPLHNTLTKAWKAFTEASGKPVGLHAILEKGIPHGAGLGGGSSDAASLLLFLNESADHPLSKTELLAVATDVGADVPFFLYDTPCMASGTGNLLTPYPNIVRDLKLQGRHLLLLCPASVVSTPWAYQAWDAAHLKQDLLTDNKKQNIKHVEFSRADVFENSFEQVVFARYPELRLLKEKLYAQGADIAVMSGSGASLFGIFSDQNQAEAAEQYWNDRHVTVFHHVL
ncbi:MAG: 4-(cytidine 5'-diphospho)-2-C-methyl-D-erythritol kinase [Desulfovibrionaceae bacterium]|nr:4-(cytidine 5'-diphospho)-2-C-methyl-D-erythritol kinase [Desulfovibrionaceae bacterium]